MKCQRCAADSEVLETRTSGPWVRRTRLCFNGHKFVTYEVYRGNIDMRTRGPTERGLNERSMAAARKWRIEHNPQMTATELARELGITEARVRQIRKELK